MEKGRTPHVVMTGSLKTLQHSWQQSFTEGCSANTWGSCSQTKSHVLLWQPCLGSCSTPFLWELQTSVEHLLSLCLRFSAVTYHVFFFFMQRERGAQRHVGLGVERADWDGWIRPSRSADGRLSSGKITVLTSTAALCSQDHWGVSDHDKWSV